MDNLVNEALVGFTLSRNDLIETVQGRLDEPHIKPVLDLLDKIINDLLTTHDLNLDDCEKLEELNLKMMAEEIRIHYNK
jgi:hypothetical protein